MIILTTNGVTTQNNEYGNAWAVTTNLAKKTPKPVLLDFCYCDYECDYFEYAFWSDGDWYENDKTSVIVNLQDQNGSVSVKVNEEDVTEDVAEIFDYGTRKGFIIDWKLVANEFGNGDYKINVTINEFGKDIKKSSHNYRVTPFNPILAERTIKLETVNTGIIQNGFDYRGLKWPQSIRVFGKLTYNPVLTTDQYEDLDREFQTFQSSVRDDFKLSLHYMPSSVYEQLWRNDLLSTEIKVSNYGTFDFKQFRRKKLSISEFGEVTYAQDKRLGTQEIILKDQDLYLKQFPQK